jgi:hypothetical protein
MEMEKAESLTMRGPTDVDASMCATVCMRPVSRELEVWKATAQRSLDVATAPTKLSQPEQGGRVDDVSDGTHGRLPLVDGLPIPRSEQD